MFLKCLDDVFMCHDPGPVFTRPVIGFFQNAMDGTKTDGKLIFVRDILFTVFHHGGHALGREGQQLLLPAHPCYEAGVLLNGGGVAFDFIVEIGPDFEGLIKLRVLILKVFEGFIVAQQNHFDVQRNRLRFEGNGSETAFFGNILNLKAPGSQGPRERFPYKGICHHGINFHDQVAAVGVQ